MIEVTTIQQARTAFALNPEEPVKCIPRPTLKKVCATLEEAEELFYYMSKPAPNTLEIVQFLHCGLCLKERPRNQSPLEWARLSIGFTPHGIQAWCVRHECNIVHVDFEGHPHPANTSIHQQDDLGL